MMKIMMPLMDVAGDSAGGSTAVKEDVVASLRKNVKHGDVLAIRLKKTCRRFNDPSKLRIFFLTINESNMAGENPEKMTGWFGDTRESQGEIMTVWLDQIEEYAIVAKYDASGGLAYKATWNCLWRELLNEREKNYSLSLELMRLKNSVREQIFKIFGKEFIESFFKADNGG